MHIGIAFEPSQSWLRTTIRGVTRYCNDHRPGWTLLPIWFAGIRGAGDAERARRWGGIQVAGLLMAVNDQVHRLAFPKAARVMLGEPRPGVTVDDPVVSTDQRALGTEAADELLRRGFRRLGAFTTADMRLPASQLKWLGFQEAARRHGIEPTRFVEGKRTRRRKRWRLDEQLLDLRDWLADQPGPLGLMTSPPDHAWRALVACQEAGLRVPEDVAIICAGDDDAMLPYTRPPLSGICEDSERVGYEAARVLAKLMAGELAPPRVLVPPIGVLPRASTDVRAIEDPELSRIVSYIWQHVGEGLSVNDLLEAFPVARSSLLLRFKRELGRSPSDEIRRSRLETAKRLLMTTDRPLRVVAIDSGYGSPSQLTRAIREATGRTPTQFRKQFRA
jgi:LacI family transcriptional regulator